MLRNNVTCTSLAGLELGRLEGWATSPRLQLQHDLASPCSTAELSQEVLEPIVISEAMLRGAHVRFDTELVAVSQDADGVTARVLDRLTGAEYDIRCAYLVGADGANSRVVQDLGLTLEGRTKLGANLAIRFRADLSQYVEHRPGDMFWMVQPGFGILGLSIGSLRVAHPWDRWIGSWGYDPNGPEPELSDQAAKEIVHRLIGDDTVEVDIEAVNTWTMNAVHAQKISEGRIFCVGDAIHRHPPANGLGSNTSMQDSFNLAWKLALAVRGKAGAGLLSTYEQERAPVAEHLVKKTIGNMGLFAPIAEALGLTRHAQSQEEIDGLIEALLAEDEEGARRRAAFRDAVAGHVYLHSAIGGEHNLLYVSDAIVPDEVELTVEDPELEVVLGLQNGRRVPHAWLTKNQRQLSTLDVCGKGKFTLLTGPLGRPWAALANNISSDLGIPLTCHVIGLGAELDDPYGEFANLCLPDETGAILVRPDQVVAWHATSMPADPSGVLTDVIRGILDL